MKRCPACGTVSLDSKMVCDACGTDISDVPVESMEQIELELKNESRRTKAGEQKELKKTKTRLAVQGVVVMIVAIGLILAGSYLLVSQTSQTNREYGFVLTLGGIGIFLSVLQGILR